MTAPVGERQSPPQLDPIVEELRTPPSGLGQMTLNDVGRALTHYRPALAVVAGLVVLSILLPGPRRIEVDVFAAPSQLGVASAHTTPRAEAAPDAAEPPAPLEEAPLAAAPPLHGAYLGATSTFGADLTTIPGVAGPSPSDASTPAATAPLEPAGPPPAQPLKIVDSTWATRSAGTPLAAQGVPKDSLPVGRRVGQDDKQSFVRLSGTAPKLVLKLAGDDGQRAADTAAVRACPITSPGWYSGEAVSWDARPPYKEQGCVDGVKGADRTWTFDLSSIPDRGGQRGFALVPGPNAGLDFQVAFQRS